MNTYAVAKINGEDHGLQFHSVQIRQELFGPSILHVELGYPPTDASKAFDKASNSWLGDQLEVTFADKFDTAIKKVYKGTITSLSLMPESLVIHAQSDDYVLAAGKKHRSFVDMHVHDIVNDVVKKSVTKNDVKGPAKSLKFRFLHQYDETDLEFLKRLAEFDGCVFFHDGEEFVYADKLGGRKKVTLAAQDVSDVVLRCSLEPYKWRGAPYDYVKHTEPKDSTVQSGSYSAPSHPFVSRTYQKTQKVFKNAVGDAYNETVINKGEFETYLKNRLSLAGGRFVTVEANTNHPMVAIGRTIDSKDHVILKDPVVVTALSIHFAGNVYSAVLEAVAENVVLTRSGGGARPEKSMLQPAVVTDNKDPEKIGRVQVRYLWDTDGGAPAWARVVQQGAGKTGNGKAYGAHYTPRNGDQVLIGWENGDPSHPVVFGGMYHSESKPDFITENGTEEVLVARTPNESTIRVLDKKDSEEIVIAMRENKNIVRLEMKGPKITVESLDGTIVVHSKTIQFNADEKIEMKAKNIELTTQQNFKVEATGNANIKATQNAVLEATGSCNIKGTQSCEVEGTGGMTVKNAAAKIAMTGPTVNVNNGALEVM